jgi:hypothetical protein
MKGFGKKVRRDVGNNADHFAPLLEGACREETCERLDLHAPGPGNCIKRVGRERLYKTRSEKFGAEPWRVHNFEALHESVYHATSTIQPRNFALVLSHVENDYGSCCGRSVHRHLIMLRDEGRVIRMDFAGRITAYLKQGSRLANDPALVMEMIIDLHAERSGAVAA